MSGYTIADEPQPGTLSRLSVNPLWPFLATMLAGPWLGWPWFVLNSIAIGSATRRREIACVALGAGVSVLLMALLNHGTKAGYINEVALPYVAVVVVVWKLGVSYVLHRLQHMSFEVYSWFGGVVRNGLLPCLAGVVLRPELAPFLEQSWLLASLW